MARLSRVRWILLALATSSVAFAQAPGFAGTYVLQSASRAESIRDAGIEAAIREMGIGRGIARRRLAASTPVPRRIVVEERGDRFHIDIAGAYEDLNALPDGTAFSFEDEFGYEHTARLYRRPNTLVITLRGHGDCRVELRFSADRTRVTYVMRIRSEHLPDDVRYQATYRRR